MFQMYYHGEMINISVDIDNSSNRNVKDVSVSGKHSDHFHLTEKCVFAALQCFLFLCHSGADY